MRDVPSYAVAVSSQVLNSASGGLRVSKVGKTSFHKLLNVHVLARHAKSPKQNESTDTSKSHRRERRTTPAHNENS